MAIELPHITVLLIEDDEEDVILLQKVLAKIPTAHYKVLWEQHFENGLAHLQKEDHDICLVDYRLGAHSGIELLRVARSRGYSRPIILLTGAGGPDIDMQALQAGADDYITKDLLQGELLHRLIRYAISRRKAEQEWEQMRREQIIRDEREARRNEFISVVVHELKTPLSSLKGYTQLLGRRLARAGDEQSAQLTTRMDQQVNRLTGLVNDLLDVSRIEGGKLQLRKTNFDFDALVEDVMSDIQLTTELPHLVRVGQTGKTLCGDRERIGQVLTNLLNNAIKYAPDTKEVIVTLTSDEQSVTVSVRDFGPGIPEQYQQAIFEPFYQITQEGRHTASGLGLGLAIASDLINRHNGCIRVESEEGKGTTFTFTLPLAE